MLGNYDIKKVCLVYVILNTLLLYIKGKKNDNRVKMRTCTIHLGIN